MQSCIMSSVVMSSKYFFHIDDATEHLNQDGRKALASCVAAEMKKIYKINSYGS